jgi:voltage-gated potassium channel
VDSVVVASEKKWMNTSWDRASRGYLSVRFRILFITLLLTLFLSPLIQAFHLSGKFSEGLIILSLSAAAISAASHRVRYVLLATILSATVLRSVAALSDIHWASHVATSLFIVLAFAAALNSFLYTLKEGRPNSEHVFAALSAYLLAGYFFALFYWIVEDLARGAFYLQGVGIMEGKFSLQQAVYFSFVTLSTLGYGDIVPVSPVARGLAVGEAILGQLYLAVLVARLVGGYAGPRKKGETVSREVEDSGDWEDRSK